MPTRCWPLWAVWLTVCGQFAGAESVQPAASGPVPSFVNDVLPVLSKLGCNQGTCHGAASGKGGFALSLRGYAPELDHPAIVRQQMGRRINRAIPEDSLLLLKPQRRLPHQGGRLWDPASPGWRIVRDWIAAGAPGPQDSDPRLVSLSLEPASFVLEPTAEARLKVTARFSDGQQRDVTAWARYDTNDNAVAAVDRQGTVRAAGPGRAAISAAFQSQVAVVDVVVPFPAAAVPRDYAALPRHNYIDQHVIAQWQRLRLWPAPPADDAAFLRRVYLDLTGTLPEPDEVRAFLADTRPDKRAVLVERLLASPRFVDNWVAKWGDIFRVSREWIGEKGVTAFNGYLRRRFADNAPWDETVRQLIAGQGDGSKLGPPNYFRLQKVFNEAPLWPLVAAETTAQTFLGVRMQCARCHNHPQDRWTQDDYYGLASFFSKTIGKDHEGEKLALVTDDHAYEIAHPRRGRPMPPTTLDGTQMAPSASETAFAGAKWIWDAAGAPQEAESGVPRVARCTLELPSAPVGAQIFLTADDEFTLYVNGRQIGAGKQWSAPQRFDLREALRAGRNVVAVRALNNSGPGGLLAWLQVAVSENDVRLWPSDATWKMTSQPIENWYAVELDDTAWPAAVEQGPHHMPPWNLAAVPAPPLQGAGSQTRREFLAAWVTARDNPYFARMTANRIWKHFFGQGLVEPVDDLRTTNPPSNPELLDALAADLVAHDFDLRHLIRQMVHSRVYQLHSAGSPAEDRRFYSRYYPRRLTAEQIVDAFGQVTGVREPFAGLPPETRAIQLPDTKVPSPFLDMFGRPLRRLASCECERVQEPNLGQALELLNGPFLHSRVVHDDGLVHRLLRAGADDATMLEEMYLRCLSRAPRDEERRALLAEGQAAWGQADAATRDTLRREFYEDVLWALLTSREFLFNH